MSYLARVSYPVDGVTASFAVPFPYASKADVHVFINLEEITEGFSWSNDSTILFAEAPGGADLTLSIRRISGSAAMKHTIQTGTINPPDINDNDAQLLSLAQELSDSTNVALTVFPWESPPGAIPVVAQRAGHLLGFAPGTAAPIVSGMTVAELDSLLSTVAVVNEAAALVSSWVAAGGSAPIDVSPFFNFDPAPVGRPDTGNAQFFFKPTLSTTYSDAIFVYPQLGVFNNSSSFAAAYNLKWGDTGTEIPAGTQVCLGGFEANISTNQTFSDTSGGGGIHMFGGSMVTNGGTEAQGLALTVDINNVASTYYGADININNNVAGGHTVGYTASSNGTHAALTAFELTGNWTNAFDAGHKPMINVEQIVSTTHLQFTGGLAYFDFNDAGVLPDTTVGVGVAIGYNYLGGSRETDFFNMDDGGASASFVFWQMDGAGAATSVCLMSETLMQFPGELQPGGAIKLSNAYVAGALTATGYVTLKDSTGTVYKVLAHT